MRRFSILILLLLALCGCNKYKDIRIESVNYLSMKLLNVKSAKVTFNVVADNPTNATLTLVNFEGALNKNEKEFATFILVNEPSLGPTTHDKFPVEVEISISDPISLLSSGLNIRSWDVEDFRVNGKVTIKANTGGRKTFKFKNEPLQRVLNTFK